MTQFRIGVRIGAAALLCALPALAGSSAASSITTYHYDNLRTGWNSTETKLTPAVVASTSFGLQHQVALDEQVDAQPLFLPNQHIAGASGTHNVVYVATEGDTIYAIDADSGAVLNSQNYGEPVPMEYLPGECVNNSNNIGINSTPVIDSSTNTIYAITDTLQLIFIPPSTLEKVPVMLLHAIDASTLQDKVTPVTISAKGTLSNGKTYQFNAANTRQRPALIETSGNIYAGFGSFCDLNVNVSRGWILGWNAATLAPLAGVDLTNQKATDGDSFFLTAIWMSGYGISSDDKGNLFFASGNSDPNGRSYNETYNLDESVVELSTSLAKESYFTPNGGPNGWSALDTVDGDMGSGGVLLLPDQPGNYPHLAVAAGKQGPMYLLNRDNLGGLGTTKVTLGGYKNYGCWCGLSYYVGSDGVGRVVAPTGNSVDVWTLQTSPSPLLVHESSNGVVGNQLPGFFATISSNGTKTDTAVIWAVTRPVDTNPAEVLLSAFDPANESVQLFSGVAGTWPFSFATSDLVPVVADGHVFVASYQNLSIFGVTDSPAAKVSFVAPPRPVMHAAKSGPHQVCGVIAGINGDRMTLKTRTGATLSVDIGAAQKAGLVAPPVPGRAALVRGDYKNGVLVAANVLHAVPKQVMWPADY